MGQYHRTTTRRYLLFKTTTTFLPAETFCLPTACRFPATLHAAAGAALPFCPPHAFTYPSYLYLPSVPLQRVDFTLPGRTFWFALHTRLCLTWLPSFAAVCFCLLRFLLHAFCHAARSRRSAAPRVCGDVCACPTPYSPEHSTFADMPTHLTTHCPTPFASLCLFTTYNHPTTAGLPYPFPHAADWTDLHAARGWPGLGSLPPCLPWLFFSNSSLPTTLLPHHPSYPSPFPGLTPHPTCSGMETGDALPAHLPTRCQFCLPFTRPLPFLPLCACMYMPGRVGLVPRLGLCACAMLLFSLPREDLPPAYSLPLAFYRCLFPSH